MRTFVDHPHPWLQTHFDVGNVMQYGIRKTGFHARARIGGCISRITSFPTARKGPSPICWKATWIETVMAALVKVGYRGFISPIGYKPVIRKSEESFRCAGRSSDGIAALPSRRPSKIPRGDAGRSFQRILVFVSPASGCARASQPAARLQPARDSCAAAPPVKRLPARSAVASSIGEGGRKALQICLEP